MTDRDKAIEFITLMKATLDRAWRGRGKVEGYTAATLAGCTRLYDLCVDYKPEAVLDVGTGAGASAMTLALAMEHLERGARNVTTVGQLRDWGGVALPKLGKVGRFKYMLDLREITALEADFKDLLPQDFIRPRMLIFYDIHDRGNITYPAHKLTKYWLPCLEDALVLLHDVSLTPPRKKFGPMTLYGETYYGFPEIKHILPWIEGKGGHITVYDEATIGALEFREGVLL